MTIMISSVCWRRQVTVMLRNYEADQASSPASSLTGGRGLLSASAPSMFPDWLLVVRSNCSLVILADKLSQVCNELLHWDDLTQRWPLQYSTIFTNPPPLQMAVAVGRVGSVGVRVVVGAGHVVSAGPGHHGGGSVAVHPHVAHRGVGAGVTAGARPVGLVDHRLHYSPPCIDKPVVDL